MREFKYRALLILVSCMLAMSITHASAQRLNVSTSLAGSPDYVTTSTGHHAKSNATATYSFSLQGESLTIKEVKSATYTITRSVGSTIRGTLRCDVANGRLSISDVIYTTPNNGDYQLSCTLSYVTVQTVIEGEGEDMHEEEVENTVELTAEATPIHIWQSPTSGQVGSLESNVLHGTVVPMSVSVSGGYSDGWRYAWSTGSTTQALNYSARNTSDTPNSTTVTVSVTNYAPDSRTVWYSQTYTYLVNAFPAPRVTTIAKLGSESITECFSGNTIALEAVATGANPGKWSFTWDNSPEGATVTKKVSVVSGSSPVTDTYRVRAINYLDNGDVLYDTYVNTPITVYPIGSIVSSGVDSLNYLANSPIVLRTTVTNGYPRGWTYTWYEDGVLIAGNSNNNTITATNNLDVDYIDKEYRLEAVNRIGDNISCQQTILYNVRIWPSIKLPRSIMGTSGKIRENNPYYMSIDEARGGYQNRWSYRWMRDGSQISNNLEIEGIVNMYNTSGNAKATEETNYTMTIQQLGPNGNYWVNKTYTVPLTVYRRPALPNQLVRKGNGTSHTLIAMTGIDDSNLFTSLGYAYYFGYTDINGQDHLSDAVERRYYQMSDADFNNSDNRIWVVAQWDYGNGDLVTSGRRYVDGSVDNSFDHSSISGSKAMRFAPFKEYNVSGVNDIDVDEAFTVKNNVIMIPSGMTGAAVVNVYSTSGSIVAHEIVMSSDSCAQIDLGTLSRGIYVIELLNNGKRLVRKYIVR